MKLAAVLIGIAVATWVSVWILNKGLIQTVGKGSPNHHAIWFGITSILAIVCWRLSYEAIHRDMKAVDLGLMAFFISLARTSLSNYFKAERRKVYLPETKSIPIKYQKLVVWEWRLANGATVERAMIPSTWPPPPPPENTMGKVLLFKDGEPVILS